MAGITWQMETVPLAKLAGRDGSESTASGPVSEPLPLSPSTDSSQSPGEMSVSPKMDVVTLSDLPSIGSIGHFAGQCSRCCFHPKGRCQNGYDCRFCHFDHEKRPRKKKTAAMSGTVRCWGPSCNSNFWSPPMSAPMTSPMAPLAPPLAHAAHVEQPVCVMPVSHGDQHPARLLEGSTVTLQSSDINSWSIDCVSEWLGSVGLDHLAQDFKAHRITGDVLLDLSLDDLVEIGVHALGDRKRLLRAVALLRTPQGCPPGCPPPRQELFLQQPYSPSLMQQHSPQEPCPPPFLQQCGPQDSPPACPPMAPPLGPPPYLPACTQYCGPPPPQAMHLAPAAPSAPQWF